MGSIIHLNAEELRCSEAPLAVWKPFVGWKSFVVPALCCVELECGDESRVSTNVET
ncbi:hypothetical protein Csa_015715 [Cucumis sativus]|uniref:Uncharacterized protein n=1 Tax=Cucumis sativus TaxID=3659 RepID=A0A0A0K3F6_CUCSA|nr:hypothetical protein Csa_015715 [Cucumis sativus]